MQQQKLFKKKNLNMNTCRISERVYYIGVDDHTTPLFESLWRLPYGVSYNSYVVKGEKTALVDTAPESFFEEYAAHIAELGVESPDYLIVNHMEPDHSGAMPMVAARFPQMKIVGNALTVGQIKGFYPEIDPSRLVAVKDGEELDLGLGMCLTFHTIPMVHWPETMATFFKAEGVLFTGDALGTFGALDGKVLDTEIECKERVFDEMYRYYACIVAKYAPAVQRALAKLAPLDAQTVCTTHGPVWTSQGLLPEVLDQYDRMSSWKAARGAVVAYASMYGHTASMARTVAEKMASEGMPVALHDLSRTDLSVVLADIWKYDTLIVGSPTYNASVMPPVGALLSALELRQLKGRRVAAFGNYTWASVATKKIADTFVRLGLDMVCEPVDVKMRPTASEIDSLRSLATAAAHSSK